MATRRSLSPAKAREMLKHPPRGRPLTAKQRGLFGAIARGKPRRRKPYRD